ncbi:hypothetical protein FIU95_14025 [Microbulbifer sp. THAF38]|nr:hypothetical protein FIU95_14025 [Microbulbifer sp. THAF38]
MVGFVSLQGGYFVLFFDSFFIQVFVDYLIK